MSASSGPIVLGEKEKRWHWHTWNLLLQIRKATDGHDPRQRSGEMTERSLLAPEQTKLRALLVRGWVEMVGTGELNRDNGDVVELCAWVITDAGRRALDTAVNLGITIQ